MSVQDWLAVLLEGSAAAVLGLAGAVLVFALTRAHERRIERRHREEELASAVVAAALGVAKSLTRFAFNRAGNPTVALLEAVLAFQVAHLEGHPDVCAWLIRRTDLIGRSVVRNERWRFLPGGKKRVAAIVEPAMEVATMIQAWQTGKVGDGWFSARLAPA